MHTLVADVKVQFEDIDNPRTRLLLSSGTEKAISTPSTPFLPNARIPTLPWRPPNNREWSTLIDSRKVWDHGKSVALFRLPKHILEPLSKLQLNLKHSIEDYYSVYDNPHYKPVMKEILSGLSSYYSSRIDRNRILVMALAFPDLMTVSTDTLRVDKPDGERGFIGLHVDSADKVMIAEAHRAKNRLCINVGRGDRSVLFINQTMMEIFKSVHPDQKAKAASTPSSKDMAHEFMEKNPNYPVTRLKVKPGEAYIAPTDNLVHDGCSLETNHPDVTLHFLGDFHP